MHIDKARSVQNEQRPPFTLEHLDIIEALILVCVSPLHFSTI